VLFFAAIKYCPYIIAILHQFILLFKSKNMPTFPTVFIKPQKVSAVYRMHPWVFSGAIAKISGKVNDGDIVQVCAADGTYLAMGHYQDKKSISVRIFSFAAHTSRQAPIIDANYWHNKIEQAYLDRKRLGLLNNDTSNIFRLINAEGDGMPGLIADYYGGTVVLQMHTFGMYNNRMAIVAALKSVLGDQLVAIYDKSADSLSKHYGATVKNGYLYGQSVAGTFLENGHTFWVDWEVGQKTGFFIDQRENRQLLGNMAAGKTVLNAFCYSGGFSVYALAGGAKEVHSVDSSQKAIDWLDKNIALNEVVNGGKHVSIKADMQEYLNNCTDKYDVVVLDPPAYSKSLKTRHRAVHAYRRLNTKALSLVKKGGLLFTFSCSGVVNRELFFNTIVAAAIETKREIKVLKHLMQPSDHAYSIYHPEGEYLKGMVLQVN